MRCQPATILAVFALWLATGAVPATAGPWARSGGEGFVSVSVSGDAGAAALIAGDPVLAHYASIYGEYGLGHRLTLGAQIGQGDTAQEAIVFLRFTVTAPDAPWQIALDGGAGLRAGAATADRRLLRLGASIGRGFDAMDRPRPWLPLAHEGGWISLDVTGLFDIDTDEAIWQTEGTVGVSVSDRLRLMLQLKAEEWPGSDPAFTVTPGAAWSITDRSTAQIGLRMGISDDQTLGLSMGLWHRF